MSLPFFFLFPTLPVVNPYGCSYSLRTFLFNSFTILHQELPRYLAGGSATYNFPIDLPYRHYFNEAVCDKYLVGGQEVFLAYPFLHDRQAKVLRDLDNYIPR